MCCLERGSSLLEMSCPRRQHRYARGCGTEGLSHDHLSRAVGESTSMKAFPTYTESVFFILRMVLKVQQTHNWNAKDWL